MKVLQISATSLLVLILAAMPASSVKPLSEYRSGEVTFFGGAPDGMKPSSPSFGTKEGACGYGMIPKESWPYFSTMAFGPGNTFRNELPSDACGACFQIQCAEGGDACKKDANGEPLSIIAMIADVCPECGADHVDVQALAFAKISKPELGRIKMRYRRVECAVPDDLKVSVMDMRPGGWLRLSVTDSGGHGAIKQIDVRSSSGGSWSSMKNTWGAAWELSSSPQPPLDFQITMVDGEKLVAEKVIQTTSGISGGVGSPVKFNSGVQATISDAALTQVQAFDGNKDPMLVTSSTTGDSDSSSSSSSSTSNSSSNEEEDTTSCTDNKPPGEFTCDEQKNWGKCDESWMTNANYCSVTCERCSDGRRRLLCGRKYSL